MKIVRKKGQKYSCVSELEFEKKKKKQTFQDVAQILKKTKKDSLFIYSFNIFQGEKKNLQLVQVFILVLHIQPVKNYLSIPSTVYGNTLIYQPLIYTAES